MILPGREKGEASQRYPTRLEMLHDHPTLK